MHAILSTNPLKYHTNIGISIFYDMQWGVTVPQLAGTIHPYPTAQEAVRQACLFGYMKYYKNTEGAPLMAIKTLMKEKEEKDAKRQKTE